MTLANVLKDRVIIQVKTTVPSAMGETVVWKPVETRHARVIPLDARARAAYMQLKSEVTHKVIMRGSVSLTLGDNRLFWKDKILVPEGPIQEIDSSTIIVCKEA